MSQTHAETPLGEILRRSDIQADISPETTYREITVRLWGKGVTLRREVAGADILGQPRKLAHKGQFILSRIDARNGACGLVPPDLDGAVVTNDFPVFDVDTSKLVPEYLDWFSKTERFVHLCKQASEGTTNRVRLQEGQFLQLKIPLPPLVEQRRIAEGIEAVDKRRREAERIHEEAKAKLRGTLLSAFRKITTNMPYLPMAQVAPLCRRPVTVEPSDAYDELGIRSFGKGTFHKPPVDGASLGDKRIFRIVTGDLLFNIVFAWEGAVAVAKPEDEGRVGSHRFLTCVPHSTIATSHFLCFYFSTEEGLGKLGAASPGGAGRNRTLGLKALEKIDVPTPPISDQVWFDGILLKANEVSALQRDVDMQLNALLPATINRAMPGHL